MFVITPVPPKSVDIFYKNLAGEVVKVGKEKTEITLQKDMPTLFRCVAVVEGSDLAPKASAFLAGKNISSKFTQSFDFKKGDPGLFQELSYTSTWEMSQDSANPDDNGKTLSCQAKMDHFDAVVKEVKLKVNCKSHFILNINENRVWQ